MKTALWTALLVTAGGLAAQNLPSPQTPVVDPHVAVKQKPDKPSKSDEKKAKREFAEGLKLKKNGKLEEALPHFETAAKLLPENVVYATAREMTRTEAVMADIQRGNKEMDRNATIEAQADYREALRLDPANQFALQQLRNALPAVSSTNTTVRYIDGDPDSNLAAPIDLAPQNVRSEEHTSELQSRQ